MRPFHACPSLLGRALLPTTLGLLLLAGCGSDNNTPAAPPLAQGQRVGDPLAGKIVFRFETFGNEGFWTDAAKLTKGIVDKQITPVQALALGLSVNSDALDVATQKAIVSEIATKGTKGPLLNSFSTTVALLNANAIIGVVVRDTNGDGKLNVMNGDKVGVSCVLCHGITNHSVYNSSTGGSIGSEVDGPANHNIHVGGILALAENTRAFFPMAQLMKANGTSIGRAPSAKGLTKNSTEAEFDAYFGNTAYYPPGMFDDTVDGNGNPMHNAPLFRQDLAAPYGSAGELATHDQFANTVYTALLDPTNLLTPGGRAFLHAVAGADGDQLANDYQEVLAATGVTGYPYVKAEVSGKPGDGDNLLGLRVDDTKLFDMNAYVFSLRSPPGVRTNALAIARGSALFKTASNTCITCHGSAQNVPVPSRIIPMKSIFPGDNPQILAVRTPPASPVENTVGNTFDDKMIVINASLRGLERGSALPLLMDLARKPVFLHDNSVATLDNLLNPARGLLAPHPFYFSAAQDRSDMVQYLNSLDDTSI
jgi:hypothetical protein